MTEDEMVGWHHRLNGQEFEQALGDSEGQASLACCSPWVCKESDMTERLNNKFSPKIPFHPGCHIALSRVPSATQEVPVGYSF